MKNKSLISNICLSAASVLILVFLALPFVGNVAGYNYLQAIKYIGGANIEIALIYIAPLFIMIASIVLLVFSILNILGNVNVIKSEKLLKASRIINLVAAIILTVFAVLAFVLIFALGATPAYGLIINVVLSIVALVASILTFVWKK